MCPYITILGKSVPVYGMLLIVSAAIAWIVIRILSSHKKQISANDVSSVYLICVCGGIIGAFILRPIMKLVEAAMFWEDYQSLPVGDFLYHVFGEIVFGGGLIGGYIALLLFCKRYKLNSVDFCDLFAPALALGHAIGRVGCFFGGCCYGIELANHSPFTVVYPVASLGAPPHVPLLAVPLIEAGFLLILSATLTIIFLKTKIRGLCVMVYLVLYSIERFIIEFFRGDLIRGHYGALSTSQYLSIGLFIIGGFTLAKIIRAHKRRHIVGQHK